MASKLEKPRIRDNDLLPRSKTKGVDMCGHDQGEQYIIRSDLGCYMTSTDVHKGLNLTVHALHQSCQGGDHYFATGNKIFVRTSTSEYLFVLFNQMFKEKLGAQYFASEQKLRDHYPQTEAQLDLSNFLVRVLFHLFSIKKFYIIKGSRYRCVSDLSTDSDAEVCNLHPMCQGGEQYLSAFGYFYIIFQSRGMFRVTTDLTTYSDGTEHVLNPSYKDALYFWATGFGFFVMKPKDEWGVQFHKVFNLTDDISATYSVHPDILNFLPGGMALTHGPAFRKWELIKTITNDSEIPVTWEKRIKQKVGYTKSKSSSMEHNWKVSLSASYKAGTLTQAISKYQFSLSAEYGGAQINTENQSWEEATEMEEKVNLTLEPNKKVYVWQYKLGFGKEDVLFCRDIKFTNDPNPPKDVV